MKTKEEITKIESNVRSYLQDGLFKKGNHDFLTAFYLDNAKKSLSTAQALDRISGSNQLKNIFGLLEDFETYLWVITASYYSMFYAVNALFSKNGIKIGDRMAHKVASDVFYFYFICNDKVAKRLFDIYEAAKDEAAEVTDTEYPALAHELSKNLEYERKKRHKFQYNMLESVKKRYAETSLKRALEFINRIEILVK